jgi:outer membrane biosynthesis protein TonB
MMAIMLAPMRLWVAATVAMVVAGIVVWVLWSDTTAGQGVALSLVGIASVIAVSLVFFAIGRSEDEERAAASPPRPEPEPEPPAEDPHPRPARERRRPMPPRRPS